MFVDMLDNTVGYAWREIGARIVAYCWGGVVGLGLEHGHGGIEHDRIYIADSVRGVAILNVAAMD